MPPVASLLCVLGPEADSAAADALLTARHLARAGAQVTVVGPLARPAQELLTQADVRWVNLPLPEAPDLGAWLRVARQLRRLQASAQAQLVHCQGLLAGLAGAVALWGDRRTPLVTTWDGVLPAALPPLLAGLARWSLRRAQALLVPTVSLRESLLAAHPALASKTQVSPRAIAVRELSSDFDAGMKRLGLGVNPQTAVVGVIGPALRSAGLDTFLQAAQTISRDFPNIEFLLVGDGPDLEALQAEAHERGLGGAMVFRASRPDTAEIIACLNILVLPSETPDAMEYALQALTHHIALVAVPAPSLVEILGDFCPEAFVPPNEAPALAAAIARDLELLPEADAGGEAFLEGGMMLNYADLLVSRESYDLDQAGLQAEDRRETPTRQAAQRALKRFGAGAMLRRTERLYAALLAAGDAQRPGGA